MTSQMTTGRVKRYSLMIICFALSLLSAIYGQTITSNVQKSKENIYLARIKQFNEFLDRFNYKTDFNGNPIDSSFAGKIPREKYIYSLFDLKDNRIAAGGKDPQGSYADLKSRFVKQVISGDIKINKYAPGILAEAKSRVIFNGKPQTITIFLNQEVVGRGSVKWVITDVKGDILNFLKTDTTHIRFIPPGSNETDFINLKRALEDVDYLQYYASSDYKFDQLSIFLYLINSGLLKFEYVEEVRYHILDIPGWCIRVKDFNRDELNSGWLIYDLSLNNLSRKEYIQTLN